MFLITCPHCSEPVEILQINCRIFRHAVYKETMRQLSPHASREKCERLLEQKMVYGCAKPFILQEINGEMIAEKCDYI